MGTEHCISTDPDGQDMNKFPTLQNHIGYSSLLIPSPLFFFPPPSLPLRQQYQGIQDEHPFLACLYGCFSPVWGQSRRHPPPLSLTEASVSAKQERLAAFSHNSRRHSGEPTRGGERKGEQRGEKRSRRKSKRKRKGSGGGMGFVEWVN